MKKLLLTALLVLSACGRQESVDTLPSYNDADLNLLTGNVATPANEAEPLAEGASPFYTNPKHGFSITAPEGWGIEAGSTTEDGAVYSDPKSGAEIRTFWSRNEDDEDLHQLVEAMNDNDGGAKGDFVNEREYRGSTNDGEGNAVSVRLLKMADGSLVSATFVYPEEQAGLFEPIAQKTLDSLKVTGATAPTP